MTDTEAIHQFAQRLLDLGADNLPPHEKRVIEKLAARAAISRDVNSEFDTQQTAGARIADKVAEIGGSWSFIIGFGLFIALWVLLNAYILLRIEAGAFDPYPFIFLNLMLSMLAALQAPVIMMSQNRQAAKDRLMASHDYEVNLKSEIEIAALHEKLDAIRSQELATLIERLEKTIGAKEAVGR